jgi:outer membrane lipoprotein-sorting protein
MVSIHSYLAEAGRKLNRRLLASVLGRARGLRLGLIAILGCGLGVLSASASAAEAGQELLNKWLTTQTNLTAWSSDFTQIRKFPTLTRPLKTQGRVFFKAPASFRWQLGDPARTIAVRGPAEVTIYYPRLKRAERYPLTEGTKGPWKDAMTLLDAGFPRSRADLDKRFEIVEMKAASGIGQLTLRPRSLRARRLLPKLRMEFDAKTMTLKVTEFEFADGSIMRNEYRNSKSNPDLSDDLFQLTLPSEVNVTEPGAG